MEEAWQEEPSGTVCLIGEPKRLNFPKAPLLVSLSHSNIQKMLEAMLLYVRIPHLWSYLSPLPSLIDLF